MEDYSASTFLQGDLDESWVQQFQSLDRTYTVDPFPAAETELQEICNLDDHESSQFLSMPSAQPLEQTSYPSYHDISVISTNIPVSTIGVSPSAPHLEEVADIGGYKLYKSLPSWGRDGRFRYNLLGELEEDCLFTSESLHEFIYNHPIGKKLVIWVQCQPHASQNLYQERNGSCRAADCDSTFKGKPGFIDIGHYRVAFDELTGRNRNHHGNPWTYAALLHVHCFERLIGDSAKIAREFIVQPDIRKVVPQKRGESKPTKNYQQLESRKVTPNCEKWILNAKQNPTWQAQNQNETLNGVLWLGKAQLRPHRKRNLDVPGASLVTFLPEHREARPTNGKGWGGKRVKGSTSSEPKQPKPQKKKETPATLQQDSRPLESTELGFCDKRIKEDPDREDDPDYVPLRASKRRKRKLAPKPKTPTFGYNPAFNHNSSSAFSYNPSSAFNYNPSFNFNPSFSYNPPFSYNNQMPQVVMYPLYEPSIYKPSAVVVQHPADQPIWHPSIPPTDNTNIDDFIDPILLSDSATWNVQTSEETAYYAAQEVTDENNPSNAGAYSATSWHIPPSDETVYYPQKLTDENNPSDAGAYSVTPWNVPPSDETAYYTQEPMDDNNPSEPAPYLTQSLRLLDTPLDFSFIPNQDFKFPATPLLESFGDKSGFVAPDTATFLDNSGFNSKTTTDSPVPGTEIVSRKRRATSPDEAMYDTIFVKPL